MIKHIFLLYIICVSTTFANEKIFFLNLPQSITATEAMIAISHTAKNRKYKVSEIVDNSLTIKLLHRGYDVALTFSVADQKIYYTDQTISENYDEEDEDEYGHKDSKPSGAIPPSWLKSIKSNTKNLFPLIQKLKSI